MAEAAPMITNYTSQHRQTCIGARAGFATC